MTTAEINAIVNTMTPMPASDPDLLDARKRLRQRRREMVGLTTPAPYVEGGDYDELPAALDYQSEEFICDDCGEGFHMEYLHHSDDEVCTPCAYRRAEAKWGPIRFADDDDERLHDSEAGRWGRGERIAPDWFGNPDA